MYDSDIQATSISASHSRLPVLQTSALSSAHCCVSRVNLFLSWKCVWRYRKGFEQETEMSAAQVVRYNHISYKMMNALTLFKGSSVPEDHRRRNQRQRKQF